MLFCLQKVKIGSNNIYFYLCGQFIVMYELKFFKLERRSQSWISVRLLHISKQLFSISRVKIWNLEKFWFAKKSIKWYELIYTG